MHAPEVEQAFDTFSTTDDSKLRRQALTDLVTHKALPKLADDPRFERGFQRWAAMVGAPTTADTDRLLALAELVRAAQVVKKVLPRVTKVIEPVFALELPPLSLLKEADDRLNAARACALMQAPWLPTYLARAIAECCPRAKTLFMSGYTANVIAHRGELEPDVHFIAKPFSTGELACAIRAALLGDSSARLLKC